MLKVMSPFQQYADPFLFTFQHYIPVDQHMHYLKPITEWCLKNPELMKTIAANAVDFASQYHSLQGRSLYWKILLEKYARLMETPDMKSGDDVNNRSPFEPVPHSLCDKYEKQSTYWCPAMKSCYSGWKEI